MGVTLDDVARMSGVSRATASRSLSGNPSVRDATRLRVVAMAEALGYRVNHAAQALASGQTNVLGMVLPSGSLTDDRYRAQFIGAMSQAATQRDKGLMLWMTGLGDRAEPGLDRMVQSGMVDGVFVLSNGADKAWIDRTADREGVPVVLVGSRETQVGRCRVECDDLGGGKMVADHLAELGHRRVATITGPRSRLDSQYRLEGFRSGLAEHDIQLPGSAVVEGGFTHESGLAAMVRLLDYEPSAVFVANDQMAMGAYVALRGAGRSVPRDVSIVGFDDIPTSLSLAPPLTTVRQDVKHMSALAVDLMLRAIDGTAGPDERLISPTTLVERNSTRSLR